MAQLRYPFVISAILAFTASTASTADDAKIATKYRDLIKQLVSPNTAPERGFQGGEPWVRFPKGYDVEAQEKIDEARQELQSHVAEALPYLVESLDDKRYCLTINWAEGDAYYNKSIGQICHEIIASHLEIYRDEIRVGSPQQWHRYDYPNISKKWWQARKNKSLAELQVEAIDWAITTRNADDTVGREDTREAEVAALATMRDKIAESKTPAKPQRLLPMMTGNVLPR